MTPKAQSFIDTPSAAEKKRDTIDNIKDGTLTDVLDMYGSIHIF